MNRKVLLSTLIGLAQQMGHALVASVCQAPLSIRSPFFLGNNIRGPILKGLFFFLRGGPLGVVIIPFHMTVFFLVDGPDRRKTSHKQQAGRLACTNGYECLSRLQGERNARDSEDGLILHPAIVSLLVEYCSSSPSIISRLARTCVTFSRAFPYSANMLRLGDWMACLDFDSYNILEVQKAKQELSVQLVQARHKPCSEGHSWELTLMSIPTVGAFRQTFLHCGVAHLHPRSMTLWIASEDGKSRGGLGVSLDIFTTIRTLAGLKACIASHLLLCRSPVSKLTCSRLAREFSSIEHQHWFCQNLGTLMQKLWPVWDDDMESLQPFLSDRLALAAAHRTLVAADESSAWEPLRRLATDESSCALETSRQLATDEGSAREQSPRPSGRDPTLPGGTAPARRPQAIRWDRYQRW